MKIKIAERYDKYKSFGVRKLREGGRSRLSRVVWWVCLVVGPVPVSVSSSRNPNAKSGYDFFFFVCTNFDF
jgi:hypothetical protein